MGLELTSEARPHGGPDRLLVAVALALCAAYAAYLAAAFLSGRWLVDGEGHARASDFVGFWAAGRLALDGHAAGSYDFAAHRAAEEAAVGHPVDGDFPFFYPPTFLFPAALMALAPYAGAGAVWMGATLVPYLAAVGAIIGQRGGVLLAAAFPAAWLNVLFCQNGFLTAALLAAVLNTMETRPGLAGALLGLLAWKPQLGLLFPLVLAASGRWRVFFVAAAVAAAMAASAALIFGTEAWVAFLRGLPVVSVGVLTEGRAEFAKLQSIFGLVRALGGPTGLAWALHGSIAVASAAAVCWLWRRAVAFELKAAALVTATLAATPYLFAYDLVALVVPVAFLIRQRRNASLLPSEMVALGAIAALTLSYGIAAAPVGPPAMAILALLIARSIALDRKLATDGTRAG